MQEGEHLRQGTESAETDTNLGSIRNVNVQLSLACQAQGKLDHILFLQSLARRTFIQISSHLSLIWLIEINSEVVNSNLTMPPPLQAAVGETGEPAEANPSSRRTCYGEETKGQMGTQAAGRGSGSGKVELDQPRVRGNRVAVLVTRGKRLSNDGLCRRVLQEE